MATTSIMGFVAVAARRLPAAAKSMLIRSIRLDPILSHMSPTGIERTA